MDEAKLGVVSRNSRYSVRNTSQWGHYLADKLRLLSYTYLNSGDFSGIVHSESGDSIEPLLASTINLGQNPLALDSPARLDARLVFIHHDF